ncbi:dTDP-glucose pyrophosphorylase [Bacillus fengqiuensis]|nr:dTDP-glucose pyrophosphorylase [Bacillus fengqiuensis]
MYRQKLRQIHETSADQREVTLACFQTDHPDKYGMVEFRKGTVVRVEDKLVQTELTWMWVAMMWNPAFTKSLRLFVEHNRNRTVKELILSDALDSLIEKGLYKNLGTYNEIKDWSRMDL